MRARERRKSHRGLVIANRGRPACPVEDKAGVRGRTEGLWKGPRSVGVGRRRVGWHCGTCEGGYRGPTVSARRSKTCRTGCHRAGFFFSFSFFSFPSPSSLVPLGRTGLARLNIDCENIRSSRLSTRYFCKCAIYLFRYIRFWSIHARNSQAYFKSISCIQYSSNIYFLFNI